MPLANGDVFAGYRILRPLGFGGMGQVYLAAHPRLPRQDALKILPAEMSSNAEFRARFNREAELAATLYNPHIVGVHDRGESDGQLWISMDYVDGPDAGRMLRADYPGGMPVGLVLDIVVAVADALDYAHSRGLLHRDVKPPNILLTQPERGRRRVLLADFGIARPAAQVSGLTDTNVTLGTVNYAAPEQLLGSTIDGRADQYGLAATTYHLLTGSPMFDSTNAAAVIAAHLNSAPPRVERSRPDLGALDPVLGRALSKNPADRFPSCTAFANALRRAAGGGDHRVTQPPPRPMQVDAAPGAHPTAVLSAGDYRQSEDAVNEQESAAPAPSRWPWVLAGLALIAIAAGTVLAIVGQNDRTSPRATPAASSTPTSAVPSISSTAAPAVTFEAMRDVVVGFYGELPAGARDAWNKLDVNYQSRNGLDDYLGFWSTIQSVSVLSVMPRDATSVVARLRYVLRDGRIDTEDRWLSVVERNGRLLIYDSERIGAA